MNLSPQSDGVFTKLIAWQILGDDSIDPKALLSEVPFDDLARAHANCGLLGREDRELHCVQMIDLEMRKRIGEIQDWVISGPEPKAVLANLLEVDYFKVNVPRAVA